MNFQRSYLDNEKTGKITTENRVLQRAPNARKNKSSPFLQDDSRPNIDIEKSKSGDEIADKVE